MLLPRGRRTDIEGLLEFALQPRGPIPQIDLLTLVLRGTHSFGILPAVQQFDEHERLIGGQVVTSPLSVVKPSCRRSVRSCRDQDGIA